MSGDTLRLFEGVGIELEYSIVDGDSLDVRPVADELLRLVGGGYELEVELGNVAWSNELALHVIEMKTNGPAASLAGLGQRFHGHVGQINELLGQFDSRLMPTAMHPWMDPTDELRLWPHENDTIYKTFDRVFDCRGHGWANLQSMHINLPFAGDDEFGKLHAAIRAVLPILPGLAASSPFADGRAGGALDTRMEVYRTNARRVPSVSGVIVPEPAFTKDEYEGRILQRIYDDMADLDPQGVLRHEWINSRGCIARFDRDAIEIRVLDTQECPAADIAIAGAVIAVVRALVEEHHAGQAQLRSWHEGALAEILADSIQQADHAVIRNPDYLGLFGFPERAGRAIDLWQHLIETYVQPDPSYPEWTTALDVIVREGCLARRILRATGEAPERRALQATYRALCDCLERGSAFLPDAL